MPSAQAYPSAALWLQGLLLGPLASVLAVLAVALLGLAMLQGRLPVKRTAQIVAGAFILFGAPIIAQGLLIAATATPREAPRVAGIPPISQTAAPQPYRPANPFDPYAGASPP